jgi:hypothetical protein
MNESCMPEVGSFIYQFHRTMFVHSYGLAYCPVRWGRISRVLAGQWRLATKDEVYAWHTQERTFKYPRGEAGRWARAAS